MGWKHCAGERVRPASAASATTVLKRGEAGPGQRQTRRTHGRQELERRRSHRVVGREGDGQPEREAVVGLVGERGSTSGGVRTRGIPVAARETHRSFRPLDLRDERREGRLSVQSIFAAAVGQAARRQLRTDRSRPLGQIAVRLGEGRLGRESAASVSCQARSRLGGRRSSRCPARRPSGAAAAGEQSG